MTNPIKLWVSQSIIGDKFGISATRVGKILIAEGLKHPNTNKPTLYALENGFARSYKLSYNTGHIWSIDKVEAVVNKTHAYLKRDEFYVYKIESSLRGSRYKGINNDYKILYDVIRGGYYVPKDVYYAKILVLLNAVIKIEKNVRNAICCIITKINLSQESIEDLKTVVKMYHPQYIDIIDKILLIK